MDEALKEGGDEYQSITDARAELVELLAQVEDAHTRLHLTQARVEQNVQKLTELKAEAAEFSRLKEMSTQLPTCSDQAALSADGLAELDGSAVNSQRGAGPLPGPSQTKSPNDSGKRSKGLQSSMNLESGLRNFWYVLASL